MLPERELGSTIAASHFVEVPYLLLLLAFLFHFLLDRSYTEEDVRTLTGSAFTVAEHFSEVLVNLGERRKKTKLAIALGFKL
jgi:hypothetical protein